MFSVWDWSLPLLDCKLLGGRQAPQTTYSQVGSRYKALSGFTCSLLLLGVSSWKSKVRRLSDCKSQKEAGMGGGVAASFLLGKALAVEKGLGSPYPGPDTPICAQDQCVSHARPVGRRHLASDC